MKKIIKMLLILTTIAAATSCNTKKANNDILFWNVDTQIDFMKADGKLYVQDAEQIEPILEKLTKLAKARNFRVVNSCDYHNEKSEELSDNPNFVTTFPPHCMENTSGQAFVPATQPENPIVFDWNKKYTIDNETLAFEKGRNIVIRKDLFDVFTGNPNTEKILQTLAPKKVFVYGVATNVCVNFAVLGLAERGYEVFVIEDAIKELPKIPAPFENWKAKGVKFIKFSEIEKHI